MIINLILLAVMGSLIFLVLHKVNSRLGSPPSHEEIQADIYATYQARINQGKQLSKDDWEWIRKYEQKNPFGH